MAEPHSDPLEIVIPRENVNDDSATLVAWLVPDGASVSGGQAVAQIETSKATVDLHAPAAGTVRQSARPGQDIPIGAAIGRIDDGSPDRPPADVGAAANGSAGTGEMLSPSVRRLVAEHGVEPGSVKGTGRDGRLTKADVIAHLERPAAEDGPLAPAGSSRISPAARALIARLGLDERQFEGRGLVRARDVQPAASPPAPSFPTGPRSCPPPARPAASPVSGVPGRTEPLSRAKRTEGNYLRAGSQATLASVVTLPCPTRGFREAAGPDANAIIVYELARLLRKYPAFNAFHSDGTVTYYDEVNIGFAVDAGKGLKVPVIHNADRKGVAAIGAEMRDLVVAYLQDELKVEHLSRGTFTLTDLSGEGVSAFHPLINQGQAAILGIGAEVAAPGATDGGAFNLILAFDHQLSEGRAAGRFLNELRERLSHHEASLIPGKSAGADPAEEPCCSRCQRSHSELAGCSHYLVPTYKADGSTRPVCTICLDGWI